MNDEPTMAAMCEGGRKLEGVLFDLDGTLCVSDHLHLKAFAEVLKPYGVEVRNGVVRTRMEELWR